MLDYISPGAVIVSFVSLGILLLWERVLVKQSSIFTIIPGPLVAVVFGVLFQVFAQGTPYAILDHHLVQVPVPDSFDSFIGQFSFPAFGSIMRYDVWVVAITIAVVASLETLLCVEATDKMDPQKRVTPTNRELVAQGTGNMVSGMIGGLPITQVIVRSSANIQSGAQSKMSAIIHGFFLLISVITIPVWLNKIPLAVLAAILLLVGYKLARPSLFRSMYKNGMSQFVPFVVTILGIVFTDLLMGIALGLAVGVVRILLVNYRNSHFLHREDLNGGSGRVRMTLAEEVTFLNKGAISRELHSLPENTQLELDVRQTRWLDFDILEILDEFKVHAESKNISIKLFSERGTVENPDSFVEFFKTKRYAS
jgi:MFS superfamily sulfate permease-like transporter